MTEAFPTPQPAPDAAGLFTEPDASASKRAFSLPPIAKKAASKVGDNKKARGGPRKLVEADRAKIAEWYGMLAWLMDRYKPAVADAIREQQLMGFNNDGAVPEPIYGETRAMVCADAWFTLADQNDSVRRVILFCIESGAWSQLAQAHLPILIAALPDDAIMRLMDRFMPKPSEPEFPPSSQNGQPYQ